MALVEINLFRHGHTARNSDPTIVTGQSLAIPLSPLGEQQAARLGNYLSAHSLTPDTVVSSHAERTQATARIALRSAGLDSLPVALDHRLIEQSLGHNEGKSRDEVYTSDFKARLQAAGAAARHPGGESMLDVSNRMYDWAVEQAGAPTQDDEHYAVHAYSHNIAIAGLAARVQGAESPLEMREQVLSLLHDQVIGNASHSRLLIDEGGIEVAFLGQATDI